VARTSFSLASLLVPLDREAADPLHRQLFGAVRDAVLAGALAPGARVPSTRALAADLGVSRTTVLLAFDHLVAEGYLVSAAGSGTRVARELPERLLLAAPSPRIAEGAGPRGGLSRRGQALSSEPHGAPRAGPTPRPFRPGCPALDAFPRKTWARLVMRHARRLSVPRLDLGDAAGFRPLREAIAAHVAASRGVRCTPDRVVVTAGLQQAIELAARMLLDPGDAAWLEDPSFLGARSALAAASARIVPVPVDGEGLDVQAGRALAPDARLAFATPSHQFPLGVTMSLPRRLALLRWAGEAGAWVIEDDYDSEFRYAGRPLTALQGLDAGERVIYCGTFSKTLFPALRLGFAVLPGELVDPFLRVRTVTDQQPPALEQAVLADFVAEGHFARHLRRMRRMYESRRDCLVSALRAEMAGMFDFRPADAGLHLSGLLPPGVDDHRVSATCLRESVEVGPLSRYFLGPCTRGGLILGFGAAREEDIPRAVRTLARSVQSELRRSPQPRTA
jgi:GntR family transcriptional regulator/MocR family aminotransferase